MKRQKKPIGKKLNEKYMRLQKEAIDRLTKLYADIQKDESIIWYVHPGVRIFDSEIENWRIMIRWGFAPTGFTLNDRMMWCRKKPYKQMKVKNFLKR